MLKRLLLTLLLFTAVLSATTSTRESVAKLYIATFDRAPDAAGLEYWLKSSLSLEEISASFFGQEETRKKYPDEFSDDDFIIEVYVNLFEHTADSEGFNYWLTQLSGGHVTRANFILALINGAKGDDAEILENKTDIALKSLDKVITIYIHGFSKTGYRRAGIYGESTPINRDEKIVNFAGFSIEYEGADTNLDDNIIVSTSYYGDQVPDYYTQQDIKDIENVTALYGGGIPRYSLIVAKFAKHIMAESGANRVNFLSVSMGSLVTRWMIEKNLENLSIEDKISKWLSIEGVVTGNYVASDDTLINLVGTYEKQSPEIEHMGYAWINANLGNRVVGDSSYYQNIQLGFESSTKDDALQGVLSGYLILKGQFYANDGYQIVKDTFFRIDKEEYLFHALPPVHSYFHENHTGLKENPAAWMQAALFFTADRRARITLTKVTVDNIYESVELLPAEVVFASSITSPKLYDMAGIIKAVDKRDIDGGALPVNLYSNNGDTNMLNQEIFDGFVRADESRLLVSLNVYEIDNSVKYNIKENSVNDMEDIGGDSFDIPVEDGVYGVSGSGWRGEVKVEVFSY
ncbi:MAG: hypothetical protein DRG30_05515 [Epsilonproteobacteria bacterium]|nr:MAG: hypothetical protein DRG30_05515 [Campylobacterota bacterium]